MKRSPTPSRPRASPALLPTALLTLAAAGCVTQGTHQQVLAEREELRFENEQLAKRVERLETSNEALASERVALFEEIEDLRGKRSSLERDVTSLQRTRDELEASLVEREQQLGAREAVLAAREAEISELRSSYDGLVADLQEEVESGRVQIQRLREGMRLELASEVLFSPGSTQLSASGRRVLRKLARRLRGVPEKIEVHGHTDSEPIRANVRYASNWELASTRASRVVRLFVEQGVDPRRIVAVSHGEFAPIAPNDTPEGRARNRRIEIRLVPPEVAAAP